MESQEKTALGVILSGRANRTMLDWWYRRTGKIITKNLAYMERVLHWVRIIFICYVWYCALRYGSINNPIAVLVLYFVLTVFKDKILGFTDFADTVNSAARALEVSPGDLLAMDTELAREKADQRLRYLDHECYRAERRKDLEVGFFPDLEYRGALRKYEDAKESFLLLGLIEPAFLSTKGSDE